MQWAEQVPVVEHNDGGRTTVTVIAGEYGGKKALNPPRASWASDPENDLAIWLLEMEAGAKVVLPPPKSDRALRLLYVHCDDARVRIGDEVVETEHGFEPEPGNTEAHAIPIIAEKASKILLLQANPIEEPLVVKGPFVMNSQEEVNQAYADYKATRFGWNKVWDTDAPVYPRDQGRFADYGNGVKTCPPKKVSCYVTIS